MKLSDVIDAVRGIIAGPSDLEHLKYSAPNAFRPGQPCYCWSYGYSTHLENGRRFYCALHGPMHVFNGEAVTQAWYFWSQLGERPPR